MVLNRTKILTALILVILILTACSARENLIVEIPAERDVPLPTVLPTPVPKNVLSICIGDEPGSLFLYGDQSLSARIIRQAIYDWTADESQSVIYSAVIAEVPTLANGLVTRTEVEVFDGERIVDANGNLTILSRGTEFRPAGCADPGCWETFDQTGSVTMDRVSVEFPLTADLTWSDGTPVTTEDSILSYRAAALIYGARGPGKLQYSASDPGLPVDTRRPARHVEGYHGYCSGCAPRQWPWCFLLGCYLDGRDRQWMGPVGSRIRERLGEPGLI